MPRPDRRPSAPETPVAGAAPPPASSLASPSPVAAPSLVAGDRVIAPAPGVQVVVGRGEDAGIRLDDPLVSREHGEVAFDGSGWTYRDLDSTNGTWRDGRRVSEVGIDGPVVLLLGHATDAPSLRLDLGATDTVTDTPAGDATPDPAEAPGTGIASLGRHVRTFRWDGDRATIGRDDASDIVLGDLLVSRRHAELRRGADGSWTVADLGSGNGTFLNGVRITAPAPVLEGDLIGIGGQTLRFAPGLLAVFDPAGEAWLAAVDLGVVVEGGKRILDRVTFALPPASMLGIIGTSGSGKSTLLNAITGVRPADEGSVVFGGRDLYANLDELRLQMGLVPQADIIHTQLRVRQVLEYAAELRFPADVRPEARRARIDEVLAELNLAGSADTVVANLSGGQRKRVSIATELLTRPSLLFLDEPTSGLDPGNEAHLMALLRDLARNGRTVVVITHSTQSLALCDRIAFLAPGGRLAYYGPPGEAAPYFERQGLGRDYADVYRAVEAARDVDWGERFRADPAHETGVETSLRVVEGITAAAGRRPPMRAPAPPTSPLRQFGTLARRYVATLVSDRGFVLALAAQGPIFGLLFLLMHGENRMNTGQALNASILVWLLVLGAAWLGLSNAIREIVKELPIYRRERAVGLSVTAYLGSKVAVLAAVTVVQVVAMALIGLAAQNLPAARTTDFSAVLAARLEQYGAPATSREALQAALALPPDVAGPFDPSGAVAANPTVELLLVMALTGFAAMAVGLGLSAVAGRPDRAASLLPIVLVVQIIVSAPFLSATPPVIREVGWVSPALWGMNAAAATVDLNRVRAPFLQTYLLQNAQTEAGGPVVIPTVGPDLLPPAWRHTASNWWFNTLALVAVGLVALGIAWWGLRRTDPNLTPARRPPARAGGPGPATATRPDAGGAANG